MRLGTLVERLRRVIQSPRRDFADRDLRGSDFSGQDLHASNFARADLTGANFRHANLRRCNFSQADLSDASLECADLFAANLRGARLCGADLRGASLRRASLRGARSSSQTRWPENFSVPGEVHSKPAAQHAAAPAGSWTSAGSRSLISQRVGARSHGRR
jgi:hypothetical protein